MQNPNETADTTEPLLGRQVTPEHGRSEQEATPATPTQDAHRSHLEAQNDFSNPDTTEANNGVAGKDSSRGTTSRSQSSVMHIEQAKDLALTISGSDKPERPARTIVREYWCRSWWRELAALCFSLGCLVANISVLWVLDGKIYESWHINTVEVTPNTVISVITTISKSALLLPLAEGIAQLKWRKTSAATFATARANKCLRASIPPAHEAQSPRYPDL
jgi:hypothetical protein